MGEVRQALIGHVRIEVKAAPPPGAEILGRVIALGSPHAEGPHRIVNIHTTKISAGLPVEVLMQWGPEALRRMRDSYVVLRGVDWNGNARTYAWLADAQFAYAAIFARANVLGPSAARKELVAFSA